MTWWRWALIGALTCVLGVFLVVGLWESFRGALPALALFGLCWFARPMTWESESLDRWKQ